MCKSDCYQILKKNLTFEKHSNIRKMLSFPERWLCIIYELKNMCLMHKIQFITVEREVLQKSPTLFF